MYTYLLTTALLFFVLTPGILLSLPPGGSTMTVNLTHSLVFAVVACYGWNMVKGKMGK